MNNKTLIFGHRGFPARFPENSLAGFEYAIDHGIDGLEFDVHLTNDGVPVVIHDEKINRTTNGKGRVFDYDFRDLRKFKLANGEPIPSLSEFLSLVQNFDGLLNLEFKTNKIHYPNIEPKVLAMVRAANLKRDVIYSSFNIDSLRIARQIAAAGNYCFLSDHRIQNPGEFVITEGLSGLHLHHYQPVSGVKERIWTVDDGRKMATLFSKGVAGLITDDFEKAQQVRHFVQTGDLQKSSTMTAG